VNAISSVAEAEGFLSSLLRKNVPGATESCRARRRRTRKKLNGEEQSSKKERMNLREGQNKDEDSSSIKEILNEI
jgi:hypothetical protein